MGCDLIQGYLVARPMPVDQLQDIHRFLRATQIRGGMPYYKSISQGVGRAGVAVQAFHLALQCPLHVWWHHTRHVPT